MASVRTDSLLRVLDNVIDNSQVYCAEKESRIAILKKQKAVALQQNSSDKVFELNVSIFKEYESYQFDSALYYIDENIRIAESAKMFDRCAESNIHKAHLLSTAGLSVESIRILNSINRVYVPEESLPTLYKTLMDYYLYCFENAVGTEFADEYIALSKLYADSTQQFAAINSELSVFSKLQDLASYDPNQAIRLIDSRLSNYTEGMRSYSILMSLRAFANMNLHNFEERLYCLIMSAISDIKGAVRENTSLRELSEMLFIIEDYSHANRYLKQSLQDAEFFNSRLRFSQSGKLLPKIDSAYQSMQKDQETRLKKYLVIISVLLVALLLALCFIIRQMMKLHKAKEKSMALNTRMHELNGELQKLNKDLKKLNVELQDTNEQLTESNCIKEVYICRFMELCSTYIRDFESYQKKTQKLVASSKIDELTAMLKSDQLTEESYKELYESFDKAFLKLFPNFFEEANKLLMDEEQIKLKNGDRLNTELRVMALLRLGINDSEKMASFLRCSITTVYTYRSKQKNRSKSPETFEKDLMNISSDL